MTENTDKKQRCYQKQFHKQTKTSNLTFDISQPTILVVRKFTLKRGQYNAQTDSLSKTLSYNGHNGYVIHSWVLSQRARRTQLMEGII